MPNGTRRRHKRAFVERASAPFDLLETLALVDGRLRHLAEHLACRARPRTSPCRSTPGCAALPAGAGRPPPHGGMARCPAAARWRPAPCRSLCPAAHPRARAPATGGPPAARGPWRIRALQGITRRAHYTALAPTTPGVFDTVLWNEAGEITETTFGNIAMLLDGRAATPLACGLCPAWAAPWPCARGA